MSDRSVRRAFTALAIVVAGAVFASSGPVGAVLPDGPPTSVPATTTTTTASGSPGQGSTTSNPAPTAPTAPASTSSVQQKQKQEKQGKPAVKPTSQTPASPGPVPATPAPTAAPPGGHRATTELTPEAAAPPCPPNSNDATVPATGGPQCIAENVMSTRWNLGYSWNAGTGAYTSTSCIQDPRALVPDAVYQIKDCKPWGLQGENIAQTRVIAQLNASGVYGDTSATGITPNLQWEVVLPTSGDRPDLLLYDRNTPGATVGLIEMKGTWSSDDPVAEVTQYVKDWPAGGRPAVAYHFATPFSDNFEVRFGQPCKYDPTIWPGYLFHTYSDPAHDGVIRVDRTMRECPQRKEGTGDDEKKHTYQGTIGQDNDHNGIDDFWDYIRSHPELWFLPCAIPVIPFHPLAKPVQVSLNEDALIELETAVTEDAATAGGAALTAEETAAWDAIVDGLPDLAGTASADILAGDGAAMGLDAADMLLATSALDAGFITVSAAIMMPLLAVAIFVAIWAVMHWHLFGDPHLATLDGLTYDMQAAGEFHVVQVPSLGLDVQARMQPNTGETTYTWASAVSFNVNDNYVELDRGGTAIVNGVPIPSTQNLTDLGNGAALVRSGSQFVATFGAAHAALAFDGVRVGFVIDPGVPTVGLLGNNDGVPGNDLAYADGTAVVSPPTASVLDGAYADSWRVTDNESMFSYAQGQSTASFTDRTVPSNVITLASFAQSDQDTVRQTCVSKGVAAGPQMDACMLDLLETGDSSYAAAAAAVTDFLQDSSAHTVDASGNVSENFDGAIGSNFRPDSTETMNGTTVAGPVFDGSGYSFTVPGVPGHSAATVAFDVYAVGLTAGNAQNQTLTATMSDPAVTSVIAFTPTGASVASGPATVTQLGTGTTAQGANYTQYRVSISAQQYSSELRMQLMPSGFRGVIGSSMAVDNIAVGLTLVPAQTFAASLPLSVSAGTLDGTAAAGAGTLENVGSADAYTFTVPAGGQNLGIDLGSCPTAPAGQSATVNWTLAASGKTVASGGCGGTAAGLIPAGAYTLTVGGPGVTGSYTLSAEAPQQFTASLPLTATADAVNGASATGAGRFEDGASQDSYAFTVPSGGQDLAVSMRGCPTAGYSTPASWSLIDASTQRVLKTGDCSYQDVGVVPAGSYQLLTAANNVAGTYTLDVVAPQSFAVALPLAVTGNTVDGSATTGAGDFESGASQDIYTFTVPAGGEPLNLNLASCPTANYSTPATWQLLDGTGKAVANGYCGSYNLGSIAAGSYQLVLNAAGMAGTYALNLEASQSFAASLPLAVSADTMNDTATPGAGRFETAASQDIYTFTVPAGGLSPILNLAACPTANYSTPASWQLLDATGKKVGSGYCGNYNVGALAAGGYQLLVSAAGLAGTYALNLEAPQTFAVTPPISVRAGSINGTATTGAGNFETGASEDVYTFTVPAGGQSLSLNLASCPSANYSTPASWKLLTSSGSSIANGYCGFYNLGNLGAANYQLVVNAGGVAGSYALDLVPSIAFAVTLPLAVTSNTINGTATSGAGNFATGGSQEVYTFSVPAGGQSLNLNLASCPSANYSTPASWSLLDSTGKQVSSGYCGYYTIGNTAAGSYRLVLNAGGVAGPYALNLEAPQTFAVTLPLAAAADTVNGAATTGAGRFETAASQDVYTFSVPGGQPVNLNLGSCPSANYSTPASWKLLNSSGSSVANGYCGFTNLGVLAAGTYQVVVDSQGVAGTYALNVEAAQTFAATLPLAVTANTVNGTATPGAGTLETTASEDVYTFTVPAGGQTVVLDAASCPSANYSTPLTWRLLNASGTAVANGYCGYINTLGSLAAGTYQLVVDASGVAGHYALNLESPQTFAVTLPLSVSADTVNGAAAPGAGRFETSASQDLYTFTVPAGGEALNLNTGACPSANYSTPISWKLLNSTGTAVANGYCGAQSLGTLAPGSYTLQVDSYGLAGTYTLNIEAPQSFAATLPLSVSADTVNGAAAPGAGRFETSASQDLYTLTVPAGGQALTLAFANCPTANYSTPLSWSLRDSTGKSVNSGGCGSTSLGTVAAGSYTLAVSASGLAGTYNATLQ